MANLTIRNLDDELLTQLKEQAKANERSMEGEVRAILRRSLRPRPPATVKWSELATYEWEAGRSRAAAFDWDDFVRQVRANVGPEGTPATAVDDIRAFREGRG